MGYWKQKRWQNYIKKGTVESATALKMQDLTIAKVIPLPMDTDRLSANVTAPDGSKFSLVVTPAQNAGGYLATISRAGHVTHIQTDKTPCGFGGFRYWFTCPECRRRCGVVYVTDRRETFACRKCCELVYISTQITHTPPKSGDNSEYVTAALRLSDLIDQLVRLRE